MSGENSKEFDEVKKEIDTTLSGMMAVRSEMEIPSFIVCPRHTREYCGISLVEWKPVCTDCLFEKNPLDNLSVLSLLNFIIVNKQGNAAYLDFLKEVREATQKTDDTARKEESDTGAERREESDKYAKRHASNVREMRQWVLHNEARLDTPALLDIFQATSLAIVFALDKAEMLQKLFRLTKSCESPK